MLALTKTVLALATPNFELNTPQNLQSVAIHPPKRVKKKHHHNNKKKEEGIAKFSTNSSTVLLKKIRSQSSQRTKIPPRNR